jgi:hypothetical protein
MQQLLTPRKVRADSIDEEGNTTDEASLNSANSPYQAGMRVESKHYQPAFGCTGETNLIIPKSSMPMQAKAFSSQCASEHMYSDPVVSKQYMAVCPTSPDPDRVSRPKKPFSSCRRRATSKADVDVEGRSPFLLKYGGYDDHQEEWQNKDRYFYDQTNNGAIHAQVPGCSMDSGNISGESLVSDDDFDNFVFAMLDDLA